MSGRAPGWLRSLRGDWLSGRWVLRRARTGLLAAMIGANVVGGGVVFLLAAFVVPRPEPEGGEVPLLVNAVLAAVYLAGAVPLGAWAGTRGFRHARDWLLADRAPDREEQLLVLRTPQRLALVMARLWGAAVLLFAGLNAVESPLTGLVVGLVVAFGGMTTCSVAFLLAERILREASARALEAGTQARRVGPGVAMRAMLAWGLSTGVPVLGLVLLGVAVLAGADATRTGLAVAMACLGAIALAVGLLATIVAARLTADPIASVTEGLRQVESGNLGARVKVYDGTEIGVLQAGFNRMAAGLEERERLRDLFGRHVGEDVAREALERGVDLGGEVRDVAVLFVDVIGSTRVAARRPPDEVVALLNRFFAIVVEEVEAEGGSVNKFEGDAALAIFGAPAPVERHAARALRAARRLARRLADELPELGAGIGVSGGEAVAGNVGAAHRFEFTVIGDPVNEAARLTELAKELDGRVAASAAVVAGAGDEEASEWEEVRETTLRGRDEPTRVAAPVRRPGAREASERVRADARSDTPGGP